MKRYYFIIFNYTIVFSFLFTYRRTTIYGTSLLTRGVSDKHYWNNYLFEVEHNIATVFGKPFMYILLSYLLLNGVLIRLNIICNLLFSLSHWFWIFTFVLLVDRYLFNFSTTDEKLVLSFVCTAIYIFIIQFILNFSSILFFSFYWPSLYILPTDRPEKKNYFRHTEHVCSFTLSGVLYSYELLNLVSPWFNWKNSSNNRF